jgi:hypothetical protein
VVVSVWKDGDPDAPPYVLLVELRFPLLSDLEMISGELEEGTV